MSSKLLARSGLLSVISNTPVIGSATNYSTGDLVGAKQELTDVVKFAGGGGLIQSVILTDLAKLSINKDILFFDGDPAATTFTENAEFAIADADLTKLIGIAQITTWVVLKDNAVGFALDLAMPFVMPVGGTSLFVAMVERGTADYVSNTDLRLRVSVMAA